MKRTVEEEEDEQVEDEDIQEGLGPAPLSDSEEDESNIQAARRRWREIVIASMHPDMTRKNADMLEWRRRVRDDGNLLVEIAADLKEEREEMKYPLMKIIRHIHRGKPSILSPTSPPSQSQTPAVPSLHHCTCL